MTSCAILIPARYQSTRFPGKPLAEMNGKPMIKRVYETCISTGLPTYVLTDNMQIFNLFGPENCWIEQEQVAAYENGTARCAGAVEKFEALNKFDKFINVQGDMPDITGDIIVYVKRLLDSFPITTAYTEMSEEERKNPNSVKIIHNDHTARWFGRGITGYGDWHLGVYGYERESLLDYPKLRVYNEENIEKLEQLRWLQNNFMIGVSKVSFDGLEINTPEDLQEWHNKNSH